MNRLLAALASVAVLIGLLVALRGENRHSTGDAVAPEAIVEIPPKESPGVLEEPPGPEREQRRSDTPEPPPTQVEAPSGVSPEPALVGRVLFVGDKSPYSDMAVIVWGPNGVEQATTDPTGRFRLADLPTGPYRFGIGDPRGGSLGWKFLENKFEFTAPASGDTVELELLIELATELLEVEVVLLTGPSSSMKTCRVHFTSLGHFLRTAEWNAESGNVSFGYRKSEVDREVSLWGASDEGYFSKSLIFAPGQVPTFARLELLEGASVAVRLWTHDGEVAADREVMLSPRDQLAHMRSGPPKHTDQEGRVLFDRLAPGRTSIGVRGMDRAYTNYEELDLQPGQRAEVDITLEQALPLAVAGLVLDEDGKPLEGCMIVAQPQGLDRFWSRELKTNKQGVFFLNAPPCAGVLLMANLKPEGDVFEPSEVLAEFGSKDTVFRRVARAIPWEFTVLAVDTSSGLPIGKIIATFDRGEDAREHSNSYGARTKFKFPVHGETRMRVGAEGYRSVTIGLKQALEDLKGEEPLVVEMQPGLSIGVRVLDLQTDAPLQDVLFRSPAGHEVRSGADGRVLIESDVWSTYVVEKVGYEPTDCDVADFALWDASEILMHRLDSEDR